MRLSQVRARQNLTVRSEAKKKMSTAVGVYFVWILYCMICIWAFSPSKECGIEPTTFMTNYLFFISIPLFIVSIVSYSRLLNREVGME
jgi:hypothetical protein